MSALFALFLVAAIVGIIKPYVRGSRRSHFVIAAVVAFVLAGVTAPATSPPKATAAASGAAPAAAEKAVEASQPAAVTPPTVASNWTYSEDTDEMRETTTHFASVRSDNEVDLQFPYGEVAGTITVRKRPKDGLNIMFSVEKGQILCSSFSESYISVKFDSGPIQKFSCTTSTDGSSETAFVINETRFLSQLKNAKKTVIEADFYQQGSEQFVFQTAGLVWK